MDLQGNHALITGGGTAIGLDIARDFAHGARQCNDHARQQRLLDEVAGPTNMKTGMAMDGAQRKTTWWPRNRRAREARYQIFASPTAGICPRAMAVHKTDMEFWRKHECPPIWTGTILYIDRRIVKTNARHRWGRVIAISSSMAGLRGPAGASAA